MIFPLLQVKIKGIVNENNQITIKTRFWQKFNRKIKRMPLNNYKIKQHIIMLTI